MKQFLVGFLVLQTVLFVLEMLTVTQTYIILPWTSLLASLSAFVLGLLDPHVSASGKVIASTLKPFAISIEPGCNGVEAMIILIAAILVFPATWLQRAKGLFWGILAIQGLNLVRIISLFYLGQWNEVWFEWAHLYLWQALIMLDALLVFLIWVRYLSKSAQAKTVTS
ncbi:exosortase H [Thiofilum flexile]|uniref:exosortase H n=1 Tax=Thiofilum flexile TaxID=125627 RepID=UPI0003625376